MQPPHAPSSCKVYTPPLLAKEMVRTIFDASASWLEPCVGPGVFLGVLRSFGVAPRLITAIDLDLKPSQADRFAKTRRGIDFLGWAAETNQRFDKIVGNPPYVSVRSLARPLQESALATSGPRGEVVTRRSNAWYAFLCASLSLLRPSGSICFVLPAAWAYADYAAVLREQITNYFGHFEIHRSQKPMFANVQEGCFVIVGRNFGQAPGSHSYSEHCSMIELAAALTNAKSHSRSRRQYSGTFRRSSELTSESYRLGDIVDIKIGAVTGDSEYFLLTESRRKKLHLPISSLVPVVTRARHLVACRLRKCEWDKLRKNDERVWLFRPPVSLLSHPYVRSYLKLRPNQGGCRRKRYKVRIRQPWYQIRLPRRAHGFISGMSGNGPWIALNQMKSLSATNTLYAVEFRGAQSSEQRAAVALSLLTSQGRRALEMIERTYAASLKKYEPGDLMNMQLPKLRHAQGAIERYRAAIAALLAGEVRKATQIADQWRDRL